MRLFSKKVEYPFKTLLAYNCLIFKYCIQVELPYTEKPFEKGIQKNLILCCNMFLHVHKTSGRFHISEDGTLFELI